MEQLIKDYSELLNRLTKTLDILEESRSDLCHETFYNLNGLTHDELFDKYEELEPWVEMQERQVDNIINQSPCSYEEEIKDHNLIYQLSIL